MTFPGQGAIFTNQRRVGVGSAPEPYVYGRTNELDQQLVSQGLPPYSEITRIGTRWKTMTVTPFAPIVAVPTTLANLEVANTVPGYCFVIDTIFAWQLLGTAVVWQITPWAEVAVSVFSGNTALVVASGNGTAQYASAATGTQLKTAITQTSVANGWEVFPGSTTSWGLAAATPGGATIGQVDGRLIVKNGFSVFVAVTGSVATASSVHCGVAGYLVPITNSI